MAAHYCHRCGLPARCSQGNWCDRHPWQTALAALPLIIFAIGALCAYPFVVLPTAVLAAVAYVADREHRRRAALAARADYEHARLIGRVI